MTYANNSSNQLLSTPLATFTYDQNGNILSKNNSYGLATYAWDYENRLTSATTQNGVITFKYDPFGRRIQKSSASGTTIYVYDGANAVEELDGAGVVTARFVQGAGIDEPLAQSRSGLNFYHADGLGSVTSMTDGAGLPSATYVYGAFGTLASSSGTVANPYRYTAREYDPETGLYYYRARYYDPTIGRFLSEDLM
ncbi:MAG TPA: RHS repeat-associated core domain-containing protein, partial [Terriglobales bacterium]|nr:RHS repeat-associated core domain-containing protein [Terriglobales bacterium]